jgi:hypothetical protein
MKPGAPVDSGGKTDPGPPLLVQLLRDVIHSEERGDALRELCKQRESFPDLAPYLWHSFGTMPALLQEIISTYPSLAPPSLTKDASDRVCNALALLQSVASHRDTKALFLQGACVCQMTSGNTGIVWRRSGLQKRVS